MKTIFRQLLWSLLFSIPSALSAATGDIDNDGLRDEVETNTGIFVSAQSTGTNPNVADSDGDSLPDGLEVNSDKDPNNPASTIKRPNIIYILADDMGYGDVGCFGQNQRTGIWKFATPGLDSMAAEGAKLTHHYVGAPICASSRCSFLQGRSQGHADVRDFQFNKPLPNNHTLARVLKTAGYRTVHIGKAGLAGYDPKSPTAHPLTRSFDRFFGYLTHEYAHEHYPRNGTTAKGAKISDDYNFITDAYQDVYTSDVFTAFAKKTIIEETTNHPDRPFFIYLSYDTPHFDAQNPPTRDYPVNRGLNGGLQWTGSPSYVNTASNDPNKVNNPANLHPSVNPTWHNSAKQFVTMIRRMDDSVTDLLQTLRDLGIDRNTLVVFTSDNGPADNPEYPGTFGSIGPFEGFKGDLLEGGIRVPTIAWWPEKIIGTNNLNNIREISRPSANYDWLATFAELAGVPAPSATDGTSQVPTLTDQGTQLNRGYLYFEMWFPWAVPTFPEFPNHGGKMRGHMQAIRIGEHMGVRYNITEPDLLFQIYNVVSDPKESINLAASRPDLQAEMKRLAVGARRVGGDRARIYDTTPIPSVSRPVRNGVKWQSYEGYWSWLPDFRNMTPTASGITSSPTVNVRSRDSDVGLAFNGYISVPTTGVYSFRTDSDASTTLWIHESRVIENDLNFSSSKVSDNVYLSAGLHPFSLHYRHLGGTAALSLQYSGPGIALQTVPNSVLFTDGPATVFALQPDTAVTKKDTSVLIDALANDSCNYPFSLASTGGTNSGTAAITSGKVLYTPANGFLGSTTFPYTVAGGATTATSSITAHVLFDNEIWIPLNEGGGTTVQAISAAGVGTGTLAGTTNPTGSWIPGKSGTCLTFDGIDDKVDFPDLGVPMGSSPRTFAFWVKTSASVTNEYQTLFSHGGAATTGQRFTIRLDNVPGATNPHRLRLQVTGGAAVGTRPVNDGLWHHLAVVLSDRNNDGLLNIDETLFYVDGVLDPIAGVTPKNISITNGFTPALGGSNHASNHNFKGEIDDVRIFPQALSAAEINVLGAPAAILPPGDGDSDGDGSSNLQEFIAGTDPQDSRSVFKITGFSTVGSNHLLTWQGQTGRIYQIEESPDLSQWQAIPDSTPLTGVDGPMQGNVVATQGSEPTRFYRVRVELQN